MIPFLVLLNILAIGFCTALFLKKGLLSYFKGGQWLLTWLAIGVITLMDELTSIFYAPSEAYRHLGLAALIFIPLMSLVIRYVTTRMVEIAEILDTHKLKGGGVYNFSYLVLGPLISFVAVASILVDYVLTAAISTVSAVENATSFFSSISMGQKIFAELVMIWAMAGLNIVGIRANVRVTFAIFLATAIVFLNLIVLSAFNLDFGNWAVIQTGFHQTVDNLTSGGIFHGYGYFVGALAGTILAYSGVESVMQTAGLVENWKVINRAYLFLALSVGIVTPLVTVLVLSQSGINFAEHETDLITHFGGLMGGPFFGLVVAGIASITLMMAVNTAYVASSELIERVAHRYQFHWIIKPNKWASLYRVHIGSALFFSLIILITQGRQMMLAEMYAVGLVATFVINLGTLLIYRYSKGTKEIGVYNVTRSGTFVCFILMLSIFIFLCYHKPAGFILWIVSTVAALLIGIYGTKQRAPELVQITKSENPMDIIFYIAESVEKNVHIYFKHPFDNLQEKSYDLSIFITFYSPRQTIPPRMGDNHFRIPFKRANINDNIEAILHLVQYEIADKNITVHLGWPTSSWLDRISIGVMVYQFMGLPKMFPKINFRIEKFKVFHA